MSFERKRYSPVHGLLDESTSPGADTHAVPEDNLAMSTDYLTFPNVSSCLLVVCALRSRIMGMHLTFCTTPEELDILADAAKLMRGSEAPTRCYVIGSLKEWASASRPLASKEQPVTRRLSDAMGWPNANSLSVVDQDGWVAQALKKQPLTAFYRADLTANDVAFSVRPHAEPGHAMLNMPPVAFLKG